MAALRPFQNQRTKTIHPAASPSAPFLVHTVAIAHRCTPQLKRTKQENMEFKSHLRAANLLYLGGTVLVLLDREYLDRFWPQAEAWLAMQECTKTGRRPSRKIEDRCKIVPVPVEAAPDAFLELRLDLIDRWSGISTEEAMKALQDDAIKATNRADKVVLLEKFKNLNSHIQNAMATRSQEELLQNQPLLSRVVGGDGVPQVWRGGRLVSQPDAKDALSALAAAADRTPRELLRMGSAYELVAMGKCTLTELKDHIPLGNLRRSGFSLDELRAAGYDFVALGAAGYPLAMLSAAGASVTDLRAARFSAREIRESGYSAYQIMQGGFKLEQLVEAGISADQCRQAGFSAKQMAE
jgi:hypothetical protein